VVAATKTRESSRRAFLFFPFRAVKDEDWRQGDARLLHRDYGMNDLTCDDFMLPVKGVIESKLML
jgi:hypothetical protein